MKANTWYALEAPPIPYFISSGKSEYVPGEQHPNRRGLGLFDLLLVVKGCLFIGEDAKQWELGPGEILLLLPDRYHYATKPSEVETVFYWVHFHYSGSVKETEERVSSMQQLNRPWSNSYTMQLPQTALLENPASAVLILNRLQELSVSSRSRAYWQEQQLFMELLGLLEESIRTKEHTPAVRLAEKTESYLRQNFKERITNETLSEALHFHPNYIVRCMKEVYGCTPMEYLLDYRLEQAKLLLLSTERSVSMIAEAAGFSQAPYFSSCFKQKYGISPLSFRKQFSG
ncbi:helix-turn-helix domain-containing protein [Paenibacillus tarimensis]